MEAADSATTTPTLVKFFTNIALSSVSSGYHTNFVVSSSTKRVYAWGANDGAQLGLGHKNDQILPVNVAALNGMSIKSISVGGTHTLALTESGNVYGFGRNNHGRKFPP